MPHVQIAHNPYTIKTEIIIDGKNTENPNLRELVANRRLQMWVDDLIPRLMECLDSKSAEIRFRGTNADCADVKDAVLKHAGKFSISCVVEEGGNPDEKLLGIKDLLKQAESGPIQQLKTADFLGAFKNTYESGFEVSVQAPMKAGKSTFINAMIGDYLLPENVVACTATITRITNDGSHGKFIGSACNFEGKRLEDTATDQSINADILKEWNRDDVRLIDIRGNIPSIVSTNINLVLIDTPGPNNAQNKKHGRAVDLFIQDSDMTMVLYLLSISQYQSEDNQKCLNRIAFKMKESGRQSSDRFLFVVTRTDEIDVEKNDIGDLIKGVRKYLEDQGISNPRIIPVTAKYAKLARMKRLNKEITENEEDELYSKQKRFLKNPKLDYRQYADTTPFVSDRVKQQIDDAKSKSDESCLMECYTGLTLVEATIQEFIGKYALPMKICDAHRAITEQLRRFNLWTQLTQRVANNEERRKILHEQMERAEKRLNDGEEARNFVERVNQIKWEDPPEFKKITDQYNGKVDSLYRSFKRALEEEGLREGTEGWVKPGFIKNRMAELESNLIGQIKYFDGELEWCVKTTVMPKYQQLIEDYTRYVVDLLGSSDVNAPEVHLVCPAIPKMNELIKWSIQTIELSREEKLKDRGIWDWILPPYYLIRWIANDTETVIHKGERVNINELGGISGKITEIFKEHSSAASLKANDAVEIMTKGFLKKMEKLDDMIKTTLKEIKVMTRSKEDAEKANEVLEEQKRWLSGFEAKLNALIQI